MKPDLSGRITEDTELRFLHRGIGDSKRLFRIIFYNGLYYLQERVVFFGFIKLWNTLESGSLEQMEEYYSMLHEAGMIV